MEIKWRQGSHLYEEAEPGSWWRGLGLDVGLDVGLSLQDGEGGLMLVFGYKTDGWSISGDLPLLFI